MGAYLHVGFVAKASAEIPKGLPIIKVLDEIKSYYPLKTFDHSENENGVHNLTLRPDVVQAELRRFVQRIYKEFYGSANKQYLMDTLDFIDQMTEQPDWLLIAQECGLSSFSIVEHEFSDDFNVEGQLVRLDTTVVFLGSEGKFMMEECSCTLRFMETCARRAYSKFRLGTALRVVLL